MPRKTKWFDTGDDWMFNAAPIVAARKTEDSDGKVVEVYLYTAESLERLDQYVPTDEEMSKQPDAPIHFAGPAAGVVWSFLRREAIDLDNRIEAAKRNWEKVPGQPHLADPTEPTFVDASQRVLDIIHNDFVIELIRTRDIGGENPQVLIKLPGMDTATWMSVNEATAAVRNVVGVLMRRDESRKKAPRITVEQARTWLMSSIMLQSEFNMRFFDSRISDGVHYVEIKMPGIRAAEWMTLTEAAQAIHDMVETLLEGE